jgi:hypothetical protein
VEGGGGREGEQRWRKRLPPLQLVETDVDVLAGQRTAAYAREQVVAELELVSEHDQAVCGAVHAPVKVVSS